MSQDFTQFRAIDHYGKPLFTNELEHNLKSFFDWAFLRVGAWENVYTGTTNGYGDSFSTLHSVDDHSYTGGTIYQSIRMDWCWESGVDYTSPTGGTFNPIATSVYVDGTLQNAGYYINYPAGRVVFDTVQVGVVSAQYSFRAVHTYIADQTNWWIEANFDTFNPSDQQWAQNITSGDYSLSYTNRMQLPAIVIEPISISTSTPFELGTLVSHHQQDVIFHVIAENGYDMQNLVDILRLQKEKTIVLYDSPAVYNAGKFPLDERGMTVSNPTIYPNILNDPSLIFKTAIFRQINVTSAKTNTPKLHWAVVRANMELIY